VDSLRERLRGGLWDLNGDPTVGRRAETSTCLSQQIGGITGGARVGTPNEIPGIRREQYELIGDGFVRLLGTARGLIEIDLKRLRFPRTTLGRRDEWVAVVWRRRISLGPGPGRREGSAVHQHRAGWDTACG